MGVERSKLARQVDRIFRWFIPIVCAYKYIDKWVCTSNRTIFIGVVH